ncbi:MAG: hypothetical protein ABIW32_00150 [Terrimesophilobacter sp.]
MTPHWRTRWLMRLPGAHPDPTEDTVQLALHQHRIGNDIVAAYLVATPEVPHSSERPGRKL